MKQHVSTLVLDCVIGASPTKRGVTCALDTILSLCLCDKRRNFRSA